MRFIYGKQDFKTLDRAQENCWLLTNGLGGFSSCTMAGSAARNDHALLMACLQAPNHRYNLVHRISEYLEMGEAKKKSGCWISSQEFTGGDREEDGFKYISSFAFRFYPQWLYELRGIRIRKRIGMKHGSNTVALCYDIDNRSREECRFRAVPWMQFVQKGADLGRDRQFTFSRDSVESDGIRLYYQTNGDVKETETVYRELYYAYDACDGRREHGLAAANHRIGIKAAPGQRVRLEIVYSTEPVRETAEEILTGMAARQKELEEQAGFSSRAARTLSRSADQFVAWRESTGGKTILAGYPFFEDWGRDTMIALEGCCLSTGQYETARSILETFMASQKKGLMPNLFPEGGNAPAYNTVDAALLFINSVYQYYRRTKDRDFVRKAYPCMEETVRWYRQGTDFGIRMDGDGLLSAGQDLDQVTWMDVRVGEILPTPRHGKPVEINAYWYNALRVLDELAPLADREGSAYRELAEKVRCSFGEKFWLKEKHCLKDVLSDTAADTQIRCNQIWAVSLPFTMLSPKREQQVVDTVFEKLYTPYGLRTLSMDDEEFKEFYGGSQMDRDMAYHQGTVWVFPLGAYYLAYLKVNGYSREASETVREQMEVLESALREGCIGQLPEIYDGGNPSSSKGCFAQAWSVGEILRVYETLEKMAADGRE